MVKTEIQGRSSHNTDDEIAENEETMLKNRYSVLKWIASETKCPVEVDCDWDLKKVSVSHLEKILACEYFEEIQLPGFLRRERGMKKQELDKSSQWFSLRFGCEYYSFSCPS